MGKMRALSREEVRRVDQVAIDDYGIHGLVLMENAGRGTAELIEQHCPTGKVLILCGGGNNGGDGFVIARHLDLIGREVQTLCFAEPDKLSPDAQANYRINQHARLPTACSSSLEEIPFQQSLDDADVVVDALLGTGAKGDPRSPMDKIIAAANRADATRVAVDIPSGLDCDSGQPGNPCFHADLTCTFVAPKTGFQTPAAAAQLGRVHVVSIGVPTKLLRDLNCFERE